MVRGKAIKWCMGAVLAVSCVPVLAEANRQVRVHDRILSRAESFFGVHFDFHAEMDDPELGGNTTPEKVREILDIIKPDYVEIDTKGHPGVSSYPTAVGNHAGRFARDPLKVWREETAKAGVALYAHYSSVWDRRAYELHPEWAAIGADGKPVKEVMSLLGPYDDQLLIPQLKELACKYGVDGVWIDGDDWAMVNDYSPAVLAQFKAETGIGTAPRKPGDPNWHEWRAFNRELFRRHLKKYASELKKANPGFQICSNGAFGARMPEAPIDEVDFLSLDICGRSCVDVSRYMSRVFAPLDKPWDLMSWSFYTWRLRKLDPPASRKPAIQLMREAACIIAQGGAYQAVFSQAGAGDPPKRDGSIDIDKIKLFADVRNFCMARKPFCFKARVVPQVGVYLSAAGTYAVGDASGAANPFKGANLTIGIVVALMDAHRCVTVLRNDPKIQLEDYPVIAVCDWDVLDDGIPERLEAYVRNGGKLFVSGPSVALFGKMLAGAPRKGNLHLVGKGAVFTTDVPVSKSYVNPSDKIRRLVAEAFDELAPDPAVRIGRDLPIDLSLMRMADGELAIHLVNVSGDHRRALLVHSIDPVWQVPLSVRLPTRPKSVRIEPGNREVEWKWADGRLSLVVPCVPIHEIVVIDDLEGQKRQTAATPREMIDAIYKPGQNPQGSNPAPIKMDVSGEPWTKMSPDAFLPCFDTYGQFKWRDWPGKTKTDDDLKRAAAEEADDLTAHPGPADRDRFGGWAAGPQLKATGRFRTEKVDGKWWLVDPDGRLFWSFGPVRVSPSCGRSPLTATNQPWRARMFASMPQEGDVLARFLSKPSTAGGKASFDFSSANLFRKYGDGWFDAFAALSHRRLRSWGMNTFANDSDSRICRMDRTPYAVRIMLSSRPIRASTGLWSKFHDPFDPSFAGNFRRDLAERADLLRDKWCIGLFVDNEIKWGRKHGDLARWALESPDGQPAKAEFLKRLAAKGIDASAVPDAELCAFSDVIAEEYFRQIRAEIRRFDPALLYLGCRFAGFSRPPWAVKIATRYCDVMSFNVYRDDLVGWTPGAGIDAPILIGEFHFGAHDRGLFGSGQRNALTQEGRAAAIGRYVGSALAHPLVVGVHWHQYADQATSGRFDGEHFQVGLTDICDRPYPETIQALRAVGYTMYETRNGVAVTR